MDSVQKFLACVESNFARIAEIRQEGLVNNLVGCLPFLGFVDASIGDHENIPGLDIDTTKRFDYQLMKKLGNWLYRATKTNIRAAGKIRSYKGFCRRVDMYCHLTMAWLGLGRLLRVREKTFSEGELRTLEIVCSAPAKKLVKIEMLLSSLDWRSGRYDRYVERFTETKRYKEMILLRPFWNFLRDELKDD